MIAEVSSRAGPTSANQTKPDHLKFDDEAARHRADLERTELSQAFEDGWGEVDAAELPSFRPLSHGVPSPHRTAPTQRSPPPSAETRPPPARALSGGHAPLQADARATSSRPELASRSISQRSRPFLLVCFFLAGAVAGLGSAYVAGAERIVDGTIEHARTALSFLTGTATWRANQTRYGPGATRSATEGAANDIETAAAAIVVKSGDSEQARDSEGQGEPSPVESWRPALPQAEDVLPLSAGAAAKEMVSDGAHSTAMVSPSIKDQSLAMASFALLRGDEAMRQRDVIAARRFYEFAASAGVARAATAVGRTYDPLYLLKPGNGTSRERKAVMPKHVRA